MAPKNSKNYGKVFKKSQTGRKPFFSYFYPFSSSLYSWVFISLGRALFFGAIFFLKLPIIYQSIRTVANSQKQNLFLQVFLSPEEVPLLWFVFKCPK